MNLKPYREYSEHSVINLFSLFENSGDRGSLVQIYGTGYNPDSTDGWSNNALSPYGHTYSHRYETISKVQLATSGSTTVLGMALYDVRETDENGEKLIFHPRKMIEMGVIVSGMTLPILTEGLVLVKGYDGAAQVNSGAAVSDTTNGGIKVIGPAVTTGRVGKFLGPSGADGYALLKLAIN